MSDAFDDRWARMRMWSVIVHRDDDLEAHGEVWAKAKPSVEMFAALTDDFALLTTIQVPVRHRPRWRVVASGSTRRSPNSSAAFWGNPSAPRRSPTSSTANASGKPPRTR